MDMTSPPSQPPATDTAARKAFYEAIAAHSMTPLWEVLHGLVPHRPTRPASRRSGNTLTCIPT